MFKGKTQIKGRKMPSAEEFALWGAYELSFEELLEVNGGKIVKDDPWKDKNSETCPYSSNVPRENSSSGSSGTSSGGGSSSSGSYSSSSGSSSSGVSSGGSSTSNGGSSGGGSSSSGSSSGSVSSNSGGSNKGEDTSPTAGGGAPRTEVSPPSGSGSSSGGSLSGGSSGRNTGSYGGGGSFDRSSNERDRDSDRDSPGSSGSSESTYHPPAQNQPAPKPSAGNNAPSAQNQPETLPKGQKQEMSSKNEKIRYFWEAAGGKSSDGKAKGLYSASGFDGRLSDKQFNLFVNAGGADYTLEKTLFDSENFKVDFSATMGTCQAEAWAGMKDGKIGVSAEASLVKYTANVDVSAFGKTVRIAGEFGLGSGAGKSFGVGIFKTASSDGMFFESDIYLRNW